MYLLLLGALCFNYRPAVLLVVAWYGGSCETEVSPGCTPPYQAGSVNNCSPSYILISVSERFSDIIFIILSDLEFWYLIYWGFWYQILGCSRGLTRDRGGSFLAVTFARVTFSTGVASLSYVWFQFLCNLAVPLTHIPNYLYIWKEKGFIAGIARTQQPRCRRYIEPVVACKSM
jgi:hypothetical protein